MPVPEVARLKTLKTALLYWAVLFIAITVAAGIVYAAEQQGLRLAADEPQVQIVSDAAYALENGQPIDRIVSQLPIDLARSLSPFVIIYDAEKRVVSSTGTLNGNVPSLPAGVLDRASKHGEDRVTWTPAPSVRIAAVVMPFAGPNPGFILVGRSLREVEYRIGQIGRLVFLSWLAASVATLVAVIISALLAARLVRGGA